MIIIRGKRKKNGKREAQINKQPRKIRKKRELGKERDRDRRINSQARRDMKNNKMEARHDRRTYEQAST